MLQSFFFIVLAFEQFSGIWELFYTYTLNNYLLKCRRKEELHY